MGGREEEEEVAVENGPSPQRLQQENDIKDVDPERPPSSFLEPFRHQVIAALPSLPLYLHVIITSFRSADMWVFSAGMLTTCVSPSPRGKTTSTAVSPRASPTSPPSIVVS